MNLDRGYRLLVSELNCWYFQFMSMLFARSCCFFQSEPVNGQMNVDSHHTMKIILLAVIFIVAAPSAFLQETEECKCVPYYLCNATTGTIIDDGSAAGLITERLGDCNCNCPVSEVKQVCCLLLNATTTSAPTTSTVTQPPVRTSVLCGVRNPDGVGYKQDGADDNMKFGEFPWLVEILVDSGLSKCGGSLIHPSVVLTAAHCVTRKQTYIVRAGEWDNSQTVELLPHQDLSVAAKKIHDEYNPAVLYNDVALLFLSGSFNLTAHVQLACLAPKGADLGDGKCVVVGRTKDEKGQYPAIPKRIDLDLVDKERCNTKLRGTRLGQSFNLHRSALCAGGEKGKDACLGDGGGPLMCPISGEEDRYQLAGMVSWGVGCHQDGLPGVYTNVGYLREWVDKEMKERNLKTTQYTF